MIFRYTALTAQGEEKQGTVDASSEQAAIGLLQKNGLMVSSIEEGEGGSLLNMNLTVFERVSNKDVVLVSRQIATLFESSISSLRIFQLIGEIADNPMLARTLSEVAEDIQGGDSIADALARHPKVFSDFYVSMVRAGEESGKLNEIFLYLADYMDRTYQLTSKVKNALIYPAFVVVVFISVMVLMLTMVIPQLAEIIKSSGNEPPIYTKIVIGASDFLVHYGVFLAVIIILAAIAVWQYGDRLGISWSRIKISLPYIGDLYRKFYISRIADNLNTMISGGVSMVHSIQISSDNVGNAIYKEILDEIAIKVQDGSSVSQAMSDYDEIPNIMVQMTKVGEETGEVGGILSTLATFYRREVHSAVDTMIGLIEPAMIVGLGVGVGVLLASVLMPIYNMSMSVG